MLRNNHYEVAFASYLQLRQLGYVAVDEHRRAQLVDESLKSLDFIVSIPGKKHLLVDVKGRQPARSQKTRIKKTALIHANPFGQEDDISEEETMGSFMNPGRFLKAPASNWVTTEDLQGLNRWQNQFGQEFISVFIFSHVLTESNKSLLHSGDYINSTIVHKNEHYCFSVITLRDYALHMQQRSPKWKTWWLKHDDFRKLAKPVSHYL